MVKLYTIKPITLFLMISVMCVFKSSQSSQESDSSPSQSIVEEESEDKTDSKSTFERYEPILKRQMFGVPPAGFDPSISPVNVKASRRDGEKEQLTPEQQKLQKSVKFTVLNLDSSGSVMVGFSDHTDPKMPKHFYMKVGETFRGWKVVEADVLAGTAVLEKDGIRLDMTLGEQAKAAQSTSGTNLGSNAGKSMSERRLMRLRAREADERARAEQAKREDQAAQEQREQEAAERAESNMMILQLRDEIKKIRVQQEATAADNNKEHTESSHVEN